MRTLLKTVVAVISISLVGCVAPPKLPQAKSPQSKQLITQLKKSFYNLPDTYYLPLADMHVGGRATNIMKNYKGASKRYVDEFGRNYVTKGNAQVALHSDTPLLRKSGASFARTIVMSPYTQKHIIDYANSPEVRYFISTYGSKELLSLSRTCFNASSGINYTGDALNLNVTRHSKANLRNSMYGLRNGSPEKLRSAYAKLIKTKLDTNMDDLSAYVDLCLSQDKAIASALDKGAISYNNYLRAIEYKDWPIEAKRFYGKISIHVKTALTTKGKR